MTVLLDTNVLVRLDHVGSPDRDTARRAIEQLFDDQCGLRTVPQVLYEYWVVVTRPTHSNGLGLSTEDAARMLNDLKELFPPFRDERGILEPWEQLVARHQCQGKVAHDTRIVAAMIRHGLTHLLTFNHKHFARFSEITAISPEDLVTGTASIA